MSQDNRYKEIAKFFLHLGWTGFGGPLALISQMQSELVENRKWIALSEFRQALAMIKAMPGPVAFQMALYLGYRRTNRWGSLLGGVMLLLPATLLMIALAVSYSTIQKYSGATIIFSGFQMGALVLIALSVKTLTSGYLKHPRFWGLGTIALVLLAAGAVPEPVLIFAAGAWSVFFDRLKHQRVLHEMAVSLVTLAWFCFKAGAFVFGTGYAMVPVLEHDFVTQAGWVTQLQFMDAMAFAQLTPGPISVSVTFLAQQLLGWQGAVVATVMIFAASAFHQLTWFPRFLGWLTQQKWVSSFLLGAMSVVTAGVLLSIFKLGSGSSAVQFVVFFVFLGLALRTRIPGWGVVLGSGAMAWVLALLSAI